MVKVHLEKVPGAKKYKTVEGSVYLTFEETWEKNYGNFVVYAYENGYRRAILKLGKGKYVFLSQAGEGEYVLELKEFSDESLYESEKDLFFAGAAGIELIPSDVPSYREFPTLLVGGVLAVLTIAFVFYKALVPSSAPPKKPTIIETFVAPLSEEERIALKMLATRDFLDDLRAEVEKIKSTAYARIGAVSLVWAQDNASQKVSYSFSEEYMYPVEGAVLSGQTPGGPYWTVEVKQEKVYVREDVSRLGKGASFDRCAEFLLEFGATPHRRTERMVVFQMTGKKASELVEFIEPFQVCPIYLDSFMISSGMVTGNVVLVRK